MGLGPNPAELFLRSYDAVSEMVYRLIYKSTVFADRAGPKPSHSPLFSQSTALPSTLPLPLYPFQSWEWKRRQAAMQ